MYLAGCGCAKMHREVSALHGNVRTGWGRLEQAGGREFLGQAVGTAALDGSDMIAGCTGSQNALQTLVGYTTYTPRGPDPGLGRRGPLGPKMLQGIDWQKCPKVARQELWWWMSAKQSESPPLFAKGGDSTTSGETSIYRMIRTNASSLKSIAQIT